VSGAEVLLALLVLTYVGSVLVGGRTIRGFGLPSGAEYLVLGVVLGPHVLGVVQRSTVMNFETLFVVAAAWLAFVSGLGWGIVGRRSIHFGRALVGVVMAVLVGAAVSLATYFAFTRLGTFQGRERVLWALASGAVGCETTRHAVRWVVERHGTRGPVSDWVADLARSSAIVPVLWIAVMFAMAPDAPLAGFMVPVRFGIGLGIGVVLGLVAAVLLGREFRRDESWGILLGTSLLAAGVATRLGLAAVATLFVMGLTLSAVSRHRLEIKLMVQPTEKPMFLPVALVVGAYVDFDAVPKLGWVARRGGARARPRARYLHQTGAPGLADARPRHVVDRDHLARGRLLGVREASGPGEQHDPRDRSGRRLARRNARPRAAPPGPRSRRRNPRRRRCRAGAALDA
jgi:Kef-type K+ transport system membrane component KefB